MNMEEYGIFNDEGLIEGLMFSDDEANMTLKQNYSADDNCHVAIICPDHPNHEKEHCETCNSDNE